jgi:hypothetical protein
VIGGLLIAVSLLAQASQGGAAAEVRPSCRASDFSIAVGFAISPATGQNPLTLRLKNRGANTCVLFGYPTISLADRRGAIPFAIRRGGDQMVTARRPTPVLVRVRGSAFVVLNKYRCDLGDRRLARTLRLGFPTDASRRLSLAFPPYPHIAYCGKGDPGSTVATSPFEPSLRAALRR